MRTMDLNFKVILLCTTLLVLSGMIVSNLFAPNFSSGVDMNLYPVMDNGLITTQQPEPEKKIIVAPITNNEDAARPMPAVTAVVNSEVASFEPQFDEVWCKSHYPGIEGKSISLSSEDIIIKNKDGIKITDYESLCLELAPVGASAASTEKMYNFKDAYVDVKGIGPMKINSIRFTFNNITTLNH